MTLRDLGQPSSRSAGQTATVTINVNRNEFAPLFFNTTYYADILETQSIGSSIVTVTASDQDSSVSWRDRFKYSQVLQPIIYLVTASIA